MIAVQWEKGLCFAPALLGGGPSLDQSAISMSLRKSKLQTPGAFVLHGPLLSAQKGQRNFFQKDKALGSHLRPC